MDLLEATPAERREATRTDPVLFALVYLSHHLAAPSTGNAISLSEFHLEVARWACRVHLSPTVRLRQKRDAFVAPRESGKSTWHYLIVILWAAAFGYTKFTAAFANTATQARDHLTTLRLELFNNDLLRHDFPDLCAPQMRTDPRRPVADRDDDIAQANGWRMTVRGADKAALGLKKGADRPDYILLDDIEPDEANYSEHKMRGRLVTILDAILPMNLAATVVLTGTVTMPGSIVHQLLLEHLGETPPEEADHVAWVTDENWTTYYQPPIVTDADGTSRSWWPEKWPLPELQAMSHTRSYRKNMENKPLAGSGTYWTGDEYVYGELAGYGRTILYIDPATTTKASSDWTGLAVVSLSPGRGDLDPATRRPRRRLWVRYASHVRLVGPRLRNKVEALLAEYQDVAAVVIETNNGGEYLLENLAGLGVPVIPDPATDSKNVRAERVLDWYQRQPSIVVHTERHGILEAEQQAYPTPGVNDDVMDAVNGGLLFLLQKRRGRRTSSSNTA